MADSPFYAYDHQPPPPSQAVPGEPLWTLTSDRGTVRCELRPHGEACEVQLYTNDEFYAGRRCPSRAAALAHADTLRRDLESSGWR